MKSLSSQSFICTSATKQECLFFGASRHCHAIIIPLAYFPSCRTWFLKPVLLHFFKKKLQCNSAFLCVGRKVSIFVGICEPKAAKSGAIFQMLELIPSRLWATIFYFKSSKLGWVVWGWMFVVDIMHRQGLKHF